MDGGGEAEIPMQSVLLKWEGPYSQDSKIYIP